MNITVEQLYKYFENKKDFTDKCMSFMNWCSQDINRQQISGGYIEYFKDINEPVNYKIGIPSQKRHLLESYCLNYKNMSGKIGDLKCPELVLWMCEASDINIPNEDIDIIKSFIIKDGRKGRNNAGLYLWNKYKKIIEDKIKIELETR